MVGPRAKQVIDTNELADPPDLLLSFDPGKTTGFAVFRKGKIVKYDQISLDELPEFLEKWEEPMYRANLASVVYENFRLFSWKAKQQSGSYMEAAQAVGMIKSFAKRTKSTIFDQSPQIKPIAEKWSGIKAPKNRKISHHIDAYNHGVYWLVHNGMRMIEPNGPANSVGP